MYRIESHTEEIYFNLVIHIMSRNMTSGTNSQVLVFLFIIGAMLIFWLKE